MFPAFPFQEGSKELAIDLAVFPTLEPRTTISCAASYLSLQIWRGEVKGRTTICTVKPSMLTGLLVIAVEKIGGRGGGSSYSRGMSVQ